MIRNFWRNVVVVCGNHEEELPEMMVQTGPFSQFYSCPEYLRERRTEGKRACGNRVNLVDYEKMLNHLSNQLVEHVGSFDLTNYRFKINGIEFEVLEHKKDKLKVKVLNRKALVKR